MATSPSDQNNRNVVAWLDRLQSSLQTPQGKGGFANFKVDSRAVRGDVPIDDDSDDTSDHNHGLLDDTADGEDEGENESPQSEKLRTLPDAAVPLGLIANLSLSNSKAKHGGKKNRPRVETDLTNPENVDDDDVVRLLFFLFSVFWALLMYVFRALLMKHISCLVSCVVPRESLALC
jgi:hypothetical protein